MASGDALAAVRSGHARRHWRRARRAVARQGRPPAQRRRRRERKVPSQTARALVMASRHRFTQSWVMAQNPAKAGQAATQDANSSRAAFRQACRSSSTPVAQPSQPCTSAAFPIAVHAFRQASPAARASGADAASASASAIAPTSMRTRLTHRRGPVIRQLARASRARIRGDGGVAAAALAGRAPTGPGRSRRWARRPSGRR